LRKYSRLIKKGVHAMNTAHAYFEDGALATAAKLLREAADLFDEANHVKLGVMVDPSGIGKLQEPARKARRARRVN